MNDFFANVAFFGVFLSIITYLFGAWLNKKFKSALLNPLLISVVLCIAFLLVFKIDYATFATGKSGTGASLLQNLLTPTTICLAIPLYEKISELKKNPVAILAGILSGVVSSIVTVLLLCLLFKMTREQYLTLLPKSVTTAIGMPISAELGGMADVTAACIIFTGILGNLIAVPFLIVTAACIIFTGILGNLIAVPFLKLCRITDPVAQGIALGTSSHAIGTARAREMGQTQEAMSGLSIAVAGLLTAVVASVAAMLY